MTNKSGVAAVDRALTILNAFHSSEGNALTLAALAQETGLYKSTILRLLISLERFGYIRQISDGRYKLGPTVAALGGLYQESFHLSEFVTPTLDRIVAETDESASFLVREGTNQQVLFRRDTSQRVRDHLRVGDTIPLSEGGASAKALQRYSHFSDTCLAPDDFCEYSFGERNPEMAGMATPIFNSDDQLLGVISVTGPLFRLNENRISEITPILIRESIQLSLQLGASEQLFQQFADSALTI